MTEKASNLSNECDFSTRRVFGILAPTSPNRVFTDGEGRPLVFQGIACSWVKCCQIEVWDATTFVWLPIAK